MAGGIGTGGESLAQRIANTKANTERQLARHELGYSGDAGGAPSIRHCWYDGPHGRQAGLLLEWRASTGIWRGRIAVAAQDDSGWALVEQWVDADMLTPIAEQ
jgi:hypothetical protein